MLHTIHTDKKTITLLHCSLPFSIFQEFKNINLISLYVFQRLRKQSTSSSQYTQFVFQKIAPVICLEEW